MATPANSIDSSLLSQRLVGKVALVTGGATGIGEAIVRLFVKHGAKVCIVDVQDELGQRLFEILGPETCYLHCDVAVEDDVRRAVDFTVERFGSLNIMINNAAIAGPPCSDIRDLDVSSFERVMDVNVKGVFLGMKHAARVMIPRKKGSIISMCSIASVIGGGGPHAYTAAKHAVLGLNRNVAAEMGNHGIRVNCISPYAVATSMAIVHFGDEENFRSFFGRNANLQGVELTAHDVANAALFLASDESKYISGDNLMVDGGFTCSNHALGVFR